MLAAPIHDQTLDGKVKIWNMKTLADPNIDATTEPSKHLCTMSVHNGKSLRVSWSKITRQAESYSDLGANREVGAS